MTDEGVFAQVDASARRLSGTMLEHSGLSVERMPGLVAVLEAFVAEAPKSVAPFVSRTPSPGAVEPARTTTLFQALCDCAGLTAAVYASADLGVQMLIALDERIDDLIASAVFGESSPPSNDDGDEAEGDTGRTPIETALLEEFARGLGRALEAVFAPLARVPLVFERLVTLTDAFALGRRDMAAAAARFSLPIGNETSEGLLLFPQSLLLPFRRELERERIAERPPDPLWSHSMENGLKQTRLPVTAVLEELSLRLGDVANFRVGAILPLASGDFASVRLECGGRPMFLCRLGQGEGRYRLEIEAPIAQPTANLSLAL
jgi:flagellar motor switch protein FliM